MGESCEECREEKGWDEMLCLKCDLGYEHSICKNCMKDIKIKAKRKSG